MQIAFIGLGNMGGPMALNLHKAGHQVNAFDLSASAREKFAADGLAIAASAVDAVRGAEVVISMLPASQHVEALYLGETGLLAHLPAGTLVIDSSTIAASIHGADMAMATAPDRSNSLPSTARLQPVFCLLNMRLKDSLAHFIASGGRKVGAWAALHACVRVPFDRASDAPEAFSNANTLEELRQLEITAWRR